MILSKDDTYNKYKSGRLTEFVFSYILNEYHYQPDEFIRCESPYKKAEDILKETVNNSDRDYAKRIIDDFFIDIQSTKKGKNSVSWL